MSRLARRTFLAGCVAGTLASCADAPPAAEDVSHVAADPPTTPAPVRRTAVPPPAPDPRRIKANELGVIPVLMYHRVAVKATGDYDMTPAFFRSQLERLHRENYYPIRAVDLANGSIRVPAGKTPCVLTFDDSTPSQFGYDSAGRIRPDCAVGILLDFHAEQPAFPAVASLYINSDPFALQGAVAVRALAELTRRGFEVGNHTWSHPNLRTLSDGEVQTEIGRMAAYITRATAAAPRTMALPLGVHPANRKLMRAGGTGPTAYRNDGVLLVGSNPCPSPFHRDFDPMAIPRIRATSFKGGAQPLLSTYWLDQLAAYPETRYVGAGNPAKITAPRAQAAQLAPALRSRARWY